MTPLRDYTKWSSKDSRLGIKLTLFLIEIIPERWSHLMTPYRHRVMTPFWASKWLLFGVIMIAWRWSHWMTPLWDSLQAPGNDSLLGIKMSSIWSHIDSAIRESMWLPNETPFRHRKLTPYFRSKWLRLPRQCRAGVLIYFLGISMELLLLKQTWNT